MLQHLKTSFRHIRRNTLSSFLNIAGLALGIAAFLLILEYVTFERSYNSFHKQSRNTFRLINEGPDGKTWPETEPGWAPKATEAFPEISAYCRYEEGISQGIVRSKDNAATSFRETRTGYAEGNFFSFFTFPIIAGNAEDLKKSNTVFITRASATKYFGKENPIGRTLTLHNQFGSSDYIVSGIYSMPANSDIQYDMVFSLETLKNPANLNGNDWAQLDQIGPQFINTWFQLKPGTNLASLESKMNVLRNKLKTDKDGAIFHLQSINNLHLPASLSDKNPTNGDLRYIYILSVVAMLILAIAWFNYINLSTANAIKRSHEVGVRKVIGATRGSLVAQFLLESMVITLISFILSIAVVQIVQPLFNTMIERQLSLSVLWQGRLWLVGAAILIAGSVISSVYTAWSLSNFNPIQTLKGSLTKVGRGVMLRKTLVVGQFAISIALIIATVLIFQQLRFMQTRKLGLNPEQLLVVKGPEVGKDSTFANRKSAFFNSLTSQSYVKSVCRTGTIPGNFYNFTTSGFTQPNSVKGDELKAYAFAIIDDNYLQTYEIDLKAGRTFTGKECSVEWNDNDKVLMNEKGIAALGFKSPEQALQTRITWDERQLQIIGIVKDYHHTGLQRPIDPIIFYPQNNGTYYSIRVETGSLKNNLATIEGLFKQYFSGNPFEYFFEDDNFNKQYIRESQYGKIFTTAAIWAIVIACLGLFGLTTFSVEGRTKEIGIRKVLGASVPNVVGLLSKEFVKLIAIAFLIATPLAWWAMHQWLQDFAFRITISWWIFAIVGITTVLVALLTISVQTIRAAIANPVESLRTE